MKHKELEQCLTVGKLIERLKAFPPEMKAVYMTDGYYQVHSPLRPVMIVAPFTYVKNCTIEEDDEIKVLWF